MNRQNKQLKKQPYKLSITLLIFILLAAYVFLPQLHSFQASLQALRQANMLILLLATILFCSTYFAATLSYCLITYFYLPYFPTLLVQVADGFTNRIFPAGLGAIATNTLYLAKRSNSFVKAGYVAVLNNMLGFVAHLLILGFLFSFGHQPIQEVLKFNTNFGRIAITVVIVISVIGATMALLFWRNIKLRAVNNYQTLKFAVVQSLKKPQRLGGGLFVSMIVTMLYGLTLYATMIALDVRLTFLQAFLVLTASVLAIIISPTPGGLGGAEAGLVAAQVSFGINVASALSVALAYRFITYWLPIIPGAVALRVANSKGYLAQPKL